MSSSSSQPTSAIFHVVPTPELNTNHKDTFTLLVNDDQLLINALSPLRPPLFIQDLCCTCKPLQAEVDPSAHIANSSNA
jgi:hypothetical protein